ncbi:mechanosensitive ion channel [Cytophagaceae bacterium ABcell3]|nr:mechanosensitive ion channel [Cytophagaceae bacterium ABcell3]
MVTYKRINELRRIEKKRILFFCLQLVLFVGLVYLEYAQPGLIRSESFRLASSLMFLITTLLLVSIIRMVVVYFYVKRKRRHISYKDNFIIGINQIASLLYFFTGVVAVFIFFRIHPGEIFTSLSIFAVALTLIFKDYISNMINGMVVMFSNQLALNDFVRISNHTGKIIDITLKNIILKSEDENLVYIPNNTIFVSDVVNFSKGRNEKVGVEFELPANSTNNPDEINSYLQEKVSKYASFIKGGSALLRVLRISKESICFRFEFVLVRKNPQLESEMKSYINEQVVYYIQKK